MHFLHDIAVMQDSGLWLISLEQERVRSSYLVGVWGQVLSLELTPYQTEVPKSDFG